MTPLPSYIFRLQHSTPACLLALSVFQGLALPLSLNIPSFATFLSFLFFKSHFLILSVSSSFFLPFHPVSVSFFSFPPILCLPLAPLIHPYFLPLVKQDLFDLH